MIKLGVKLESKERIRVKMTSATITHGAEVHQYQFCHYHAKLCALCMVMLLHPTVQAELSAASREAAAATAAAQGGWVAEV